MPNIPNKAILVAFFASVILDRLVEPQIGHLGVLGLKLFINLQWHLGQNFKASLENVTLQTAHFFI